MILFTVGFIVLLVAAGLLLVSVIYSKKATKTQNHYQIPQGTITYTDLDVPARPLFSKQLLLTGKPDYIIQKDQQYIPVEVKTGSYQQPQQHHIMQLAAYCHLVEETYNSFVPYGILIYPSGQFTIPFTPDLRFQLEQCIYSMRVSCKKQILPRNHSSQTKCVHCSLKKHCTEQMT